MQSAAFHSRAFHCQAFEPMAPLVGGVQSAYAVGFDGSNDYITVTNDADINFGTGDYTVCGWIKVNSIANGGRAWLMAKGTGQSPYYGYELGVINDGSGYQPRFGVYGPADITKTALSTTAISSGVWVFISGVRDGNTLRVYVNGNQTGTTNGVSTVNGDNTAPLWIGARNDGTYTNGFLDDLRIYNRALSAAEISAIYANTSAPPTSGLVAYFPLDDGTGTTTTDTIGGLVGTLTNGPTWEPQVCPRLRTGRDTEQSWSGLFDGTNDYLTVSSASQIVFSQAESFSVSWWINGISDNVDIIHKGTSATKNAWVVYTFSNRIYFELRGSTTSSRIVKYVGAIPSSGWHHIAFIYNGSSAAAGLVVYVDGLAQSMTTVVDALTDTIASTAALEIARTFAIGYFAGKIKDVRIYSSALSAAAIAKLANNVEPGITMAGHWKLDEGTGTTATDSSGNGNHGTLTNGATYSGDIPQWFRPVIESTHAGSFDGTDDYCSISPITFGPSTDWTVVAWINPSELRNWSGWAGEPAPGFTRLILEANGAMRVSSNDNASNATGAGVISANTWQCMAVQRAGDSVLYSKNGGAMQTLASGKSSKTYVYSAVGTGYYLFKGLIDELCIYSIAIPDAAIADAAAGYLVRAGLVSRYMLDNNANDAHGSNNGTAQGGLTYTTSVPGTL